MSVAYSEEQKFPLMDSGGGNSGAIFNSVLVDMDAGRELAFTAGEALEAFDAVYIDPAMGKVKKADASALTTMPAIGIVPADVANDAAGKVRMFGWIDYDDTAKTALAATRGDIMYLSEVAGELIVTAPTIPQIIGIAKTTTADHITRILIIPELIAKKWLSALSIGDATNKAEIKADGEINLHGTARVNRHLLIDPKRFKMPAANFPGESFEDLFYTLDFDDSAEESANCQEHIPWRWDSTTDIEVIIDWLHDANAATDALKVLWGVEYKSITAGEAVAGAGTEITQLSAGNHNVDEGLLVRTTFTAKILGSNLAYGDVLGMRVFRKAADGTDTLVGDARLVNVHFHFVMNKLGEAT